MIYVQIKAGLGNQMFQYAFGKAMSLRRNEELQLDISSFENQAARDTKRTYELSHFNTQANIAPVETIKSFTTTFQIYKRKIERNLFYKNSYTFYKYLVNSKDKYFEGWWQNENYFKDYADIIRNDLSLKAPFSTQANQIATEIKNANAEENTATVSLHVRRGDYVSNTYAASHHGSVDNNYYQKAIDLLKSKLTGKELRFFVFSDDIEWAKLNLNLGDTAVFVSNPSIPAYEEIHLMALCNHHIIANSSFSWWGAWLDSKPDKIVVAPKKWLNDSSIDTSGATPPSWHRI